MTDTTQLLSIFVLLALSGFLSGGEAALFSLPLTKIRSYEKDPHPTRKRIAALLKHPRDLLVTIFMLNTLVNILLQNITSSYFGEVAGWGLKVAIPLILTLFFGEILPKYMGLQHNLTISSLVVHPINFLQKHLKKIREATIAITVPISRLLFFYLRKEKEISKEELAHILKRSEEHGIFAAEEGELLAGYLQLQDLRVREVMRPREDILYYNIQDPLSKLLYLFVDKQCSKLPICDGNLEKVLGILEADHFLIHRNSINHPKDLLNFVSKPLFIPETKEALLLLIRFRENNETLALVVDEYGSLSGLITEEDLVEVVVGDISDKRDPSKLYTREAEDVIIASGKMELSELNDLLHTKLVSPNNMVTIGGWLMEQLGEVPKTGTKHELEGFLFQILAASPNRIRRIYIRKGGS